MGKPNQLGFTLIELLAVIIILGIILAIAVPGISGIVKSASKSSFESDAKMVLQQVEYEKLKNNTFNAAIVNENNIGNLLGLSNENYSSVSINVEENVPIVSIVGKGKWNGYIACGSYMNMRVVQSTSDCTTDLILPIIKVLRDNPVSIFVGEIYTDAGATATDDKDGDITSKIITTGTVNPLVPGSYTIAYSVSDSAGNNMTANRTIQVVDNETPIITLQPVGNNTYTKSYNVIATVTDIGGIDAASLKYVWTTSNTQPEMSLLTNSFVSMETITTPIGITGEYYLWITASDISGNDTIISSDVFNLDNEKPVITINGNISVTINKGSTYLDAGATVSDNISTNIIPIVSSNVNPNIVGTYDVIYTASDVAGNIADAITRTVNVIDVSAPVITILGSNPIVLNVGSAYIDAGATALDDVDGDVTSKIATIGTVNPNAVGTYTITYTVSDMAGNTAILIRTINVVDTVFPTITFGTNGNSTFAKNRSTTVTVNDNVLVSPSSLKYLWNTSTTAPSEASIVTPFANGAVINTPAGLTGGYYLWILAKDSSGNTSIQKTNIFNLDNTIPIISLLGSNPITLTQGSAYTDAGSTATDNINGNITSSVVLTGSVNTAITGTYTLTYNVSDSSGNAATPVTRTVNVITTSVSYAYTGALQTYSVPATGIYKLEVWGAQGGRNSSYTSLGAKGGYSYGNISLTVGQVLNVYVGGVGLNTNAYTGASGGYNGGGYGGSSASTYQNGGGGGGGATDIRTIGGNWNDITSLNSRMIVAGGGSGAGANNIPYGDSGVGGGATGGSPYYQSGSCHIPFASGGTQTGGGAAGGYCSGFYGSAGSQGRGGSGGGGGISNAGGGGGGGYFGGGGGGASYGGGGGSGYIGGVTSGTMLDGNTTFTAPGGGNEVGHSGNGNARITFVSQ